jgi:hypothetical protein
LDFVKRENKYSSEEIGDLINDMQKSILTLQKKRSELLEKKKDNLTKKRFIPQFKIKKII